MFRKMPFILMLIILAIVVLEPVIPLDIKEICYAVSLSIKSLIIFLLPVIIFGLLFNAAINLAHNATRVIGTILVCVCISNFFSTFLSHYVGVWIYHFDLSILLPKQTDGLQAAWAWELPKLIANDKAMFAGMALGIIGGLFKAKFANIVAVKLEWVVSKVLGSFAYLIPIFVAGFVMKLQYDGVMSMIIRDYTLIFAIIAIAQFSYIALAYFLLNSCRVKDFFNSIKNMLPAAISGFSTMSSAASMPLTIIGAENNAKNKELAGSVIPATVNVHLVGDCFAIPIFAYAVLKNYGMDEPSLWAYLTFTLYFVIAKFSVAAIPGGGIIVMLPILEAYLGFNSPMMSLITALYILFDPVITCANVFGNGAFAKMMDRMMSSFKRKKSVIG